MIELYKSVEAMFKKYHAPAHDFKHVFRTSKLARKIAISEGYDADEAEIAGLLHDMGRTVEHLKDTHAHEGAPIARELMDKHTQLSDEAKERIERAIYVHSDKYTEGLLSNIVQDADKLDGMGAMGIHRAYHSFHNGEDYDADNLTPPEPDYHNLKNAHELLALELTWYHMLYTDEGKRIGKARYEFNLKYLEEFKREIEESS